MNQKRRIRNLIRKLHDVQETELNISSCISELVAIGEPAVPYLASELEDENGIIRSRAARALGMIGEPAVPHLLGHICSRETPKEAREELSEILCSICTVPPQQLLGALKDGDDGVRVCAAETIAKIGHSCAIGPMLSLFKRDENGNRETNLRVLIAAAGFLGKVAGTQAFAHLPNLMRITLAGGLAKEGFFMALKARTPSGIRELRELREAILELRAPLRNREEIDEDDLINSCELAEVYKAWSQKLHEKLAKENEGMPPPPPRFRRPRSISGRSREAGKKEVLRA